MSEQQSLDQIRELALALAARTKADPKFRDQIIADPVGMLSAAGVPARAIPDLLSENNLQSDVAGYMRCVDFTCLVSICPDSCITYTCEACTGGSSTIYG